MYSHYSALLLTHTFDMCTNKVYLLT